MFVRQAETMTSALKRVERVDDYVRTLVLCQAFLLILHTVRLCAPATNHFFAEVRGLLFFAVAVAFFTGLAALAVSRAAFSAVFTSSASGAPLRIVPPARKSYLMSGCATHNRARALRVPLD
jgi:hypothetical protein